MFGRRVGALALSGVLLCCITSCARPHSGAGDGLATVTPDTVGLPNASPDYVASISRPAQPSQARQVVARPADQLVGPDVSLVDPVQDSAATTPAPTVDTTPATTVDTAATDGGVPPVADVHIGSRQVTIEFTGDTLIHSPLVRQAGQNAGGDGYDFAPMFDRVRPILSAADYAICHLESPIAPPGESLSTYPMYGVPAQITDALHSAGYDRCSTASNHTVDRGAKGIDATVDALEAAGLTQSGMARTPAEAVAGLVDVNGVTVAHLSYTFGLNGGHLPADEPWRSNLIDATNIIAAARDARARGAEIVVVNLHWGREGQVAVSAAQLEVAEALTASGAVDLIVGEHVHVLQPIEQINGTWVVFGMGNFLSNMPTGDTWPASTQDGMIVSVTFTERADGRFAVGRPGVIPTWVDRRDGFVIRPVISDLADPTVDDTTKAQLFTSLQRTDAVVGDYVVSG